MRKASAAHDKGGGKGGEGLLQQYSGQFELTKVPSACRPVSRPRMLFSIRVEDTYRLPVDTGYQ